MRKIESLEHQDTFTPAAARHGSRSLVQENYSSLAFSSLVFVWVVVRNHELTLMRKEQSLLCLFQVTDRMLFSDLASITHAANA
jgi:hypothetical protein